MRRCTGFARALLLLLLLVSFAPFPETVRAETRQDKQFGDWRTFVFTGKSTVYGLYGVDLSDRNVELQMSKYQGNCNSTKVNVAVTFTQPAAKDYSKDKVPGEVRVDQQPVHKTLSRVGYKAGDKGTGYDVHSFENPQVLLGEMAAGQMIRFKFTLGNEEYFYRFSLNGFKPAYERVSQMCAHPQGERQASPGQPAKPKAPKSDSDFFDKPPGGKAPKSDKDFF